MTSVGKGEGTRNWRSQKKKLVELFCFDDDSDTGAAAGGETDQLLANWQLNRYLGCCGSFKKVWGSER